VSALRITGETLLRTHSTDDMLPPALRALEMQSHPVQEHDLNQALARHSAAHLSPKRPHIELRLHRHVSDNNQWVAGWHCYKKRPGKNPGSGADGSGGRAEKSRKIRDSKKRDLGDFLST